MKKKAFCFLVIALLLSLVFSFSACSKNDSLGRSNEYYLDFSYTSEMTKDNKLRIVENPFVRTSVTASSYFSIDANTASYPLLRRVINNGNAIDNDIVRAEEVLNYFSYDYQSPTDGEILSLNASLFDTPYNPETKMLTVGLAAQKVEFSDKRNNIVFLIDTSGSMYGSDRLGLIQSSFKLMTDNLKDDDRVSVVTYAGSDTVALEGAYGNERKKIKAVIEDLEASGSTAGSAGITTAYNIAQKYFIEGGNNRVILATDGDFNVGITDAEELKTFIKEKASSGVYFSVFGVGYGNLNDQTMETLALNGNGTYSYLDSLTEAKRALVEQIGGTLQTVAKDVKAGITFNPEYVESFRLIGYENKQMTEEEFNDSKKDAGELGSGHTVTVVYELKMTEKALSSGEKIGSVEIHYKPTENSETGSQAQNADDPSEQNLVLTMDVLTDCYHTTLTQNDLFVSSVVEFLLLVRDSEYKANADIDNVISRLESLTSPDDDREEFISLVKTYKEKYILTQKGE